MSRQTLKMRIFQRLVATSTSFSSLLNRQTPSRA
jgi:hypothetical protein